MKIIVSATLCWWATVVTPLYCRAQAPASVETLGSVTFQTSCKATAQIQINRAVALIHSFQFGSAIQGFNSVLRDDPKCAIADWGIALSSWQNPFAGFKSPVQLEQGLRSVEQGPAKVKVPMKGHRHSIPSGSSLTDRVMLWKCT